jgi:hypothetical protein
MEYIEGPSLAQVVKERGAQPPATVTAWLRQAADALAHAHSRGVIHRDIKAANLLLETARDRIYVTDFGLARAAELSGGSSGAGSKETLTGTAAYRAPEVRKTGHTVASDLYSLGVVGYEVLAGQRPFPGSDPLDLMLAHATDPVPPLPASVPANLGGVLLRLLEKAPEQRYADREAVMQALTPPKPTAPAVVPPAAPRPAPPPIAFDWVTIPAGAFTMGSTPEQVQAAIALARTRLSKVNEAYVHLRGAAAARLCGGISHQPRAGDGGALSRLCRRHPLPHHGRGEGDGLGVEQQRRQVGGDEGGDVAHAHRPGEQRGGEDAPPGDADVVVRRRRLLSMGGGAAAHRGGVGEGRTRDRWPPISVGGRTTRQEPLQLGATKWATRRRWAAMRRAPVCMACWTWRAMSTSGRAHAGAATTGTNRALPTPTTAPIGVRTPRWRTAESCVGEDGTTTAAAVRCASVAGLSDPPVRPQGVSSSVPRLLTAGLWSALISGRRWALRGVGRAPHMR